MSLNRNSSKLGDYVQAFGPLISIFNHAVLVCRISNKKLEILFCFWENSDFLCLHFYNGKSPSQDYFWP